MRAIYITSITYYVKELSISICHWLSAPYTTSAIFTDVRYRLTIRAGNVWLIEHYTRTGMYTFANLLNNTANNKAFQYWEASYVINLLTDRRTPQGTHNTVNRVHSQSWKFSLFSNLFIIGLRWHFIICTMTKTYMLF